MKKNTPENLLQDPEEELIKLNVKLRNKCNENNSIKFENIKFIRELSHSLKSPLGNISSFTEILQDNNTAHSPESVAKYLEIIKKSADYSMELLSSITELFRLKSCDQKLNLKKVNYIELINSVIHTFSAKENTINIQIEKGPMPHEEFITIDEEKITQALSNIIKNAFRFSNENEPVIINVKDYKNHVEIIISDSGIGISEENLQYVFSDFFVVNTYSPDKTKCIGLGLSITKQIIDYHKGEIEITSDLRKGTNVKIKLPKVFMLEE